MNELITIGEHDYTIGRLNALDQFHVSRKIAPIVPTLMPIISEVAKADLDAIIDSIKEGNNDDLDDLEPLAQALEPLMDAFSKMPEEDVNYIIHKCLSVVKRGSSVVCRGQSIMFDDLDMVQILPLVVAVIRVSLGNFYSRTAYEGIDHSGTVHIDFKSLPDKEDWLLRPVIKGMCKFESLKNGKVDLADIALMNDALDVVADNEYLIIEEREKEK